MFFNGLLAISLRTLLAWENRKLDKKFGTLEEQKNRIAATGVENYGPMYRYVL